MYRERAVLALLVEAIAPRLLLPLGLMALFLAATWLGLFAIMGPMARMAGTLAFLVALALLSVPLLRISLPGAAEIAQRLDASRPDLHRPLAALADTLALVRDPLALALWSQHRRRAEAQAEGLRVLPADARLRHRDGFALRWGVALALVLSAFVAGDNRTPLLREAFDWSTPRLPPVPPRLDAWIDPPAYTGRAPIFLAGATTHTSGETIRAPIGSIITIRLVAANPDAQNAPPLTLELEHGAAFEAPDDAGTPKAAAAPLNPQQKNALILRRTLRGDGPISISSNGRALAEFNLAAIPDLPPNVTLDSVETENTQERNLAPNGVRVAYNLQDDYGIAKAELVMERVNAPANTAARTLFPAPTVTIPLRLGAGQVSLVTEDHSWAGETVRLTLRIEDDLGQRAESEARTITLPQRAFTQPLPKALVEQRRNLVFTPTDRLGVLQAFDALLFAPERFLPKVGDFIALDLIRKHIRSSRGDEQLRDASEQLYELAKAFENGDMTDAERRLREAEARLRDALERGAPPEEIRRLAQELRRAMDQFLREFVERSLKNDRQQSQDQRPVSPENMLTQRDLNEMLRKIEEMARSGNTEEAQRLLNELRQLLQNLQTVRRQDVNPRMRELGEQMQELDKLQREQRNLKDRSFRNSQRGQQPQQGRPGQRQPGQPQQPGGDGEEESDEQLQQEQQALRDRLQQLRDRLKQRGMDENEGMGDAQDGMGDAEQQLGQGRPGDAQGGQQRALDGMGRAAQGMAEQMQREMGQGQGQGEGDGEGEPGFGQPGRGQRGRAQNNHDPLGRPQAKGDNELHQDGDRSNSKSKLSPSLRERANSVLQELQRRLGEFDRPREELEYLDRLLRQR